MKRGRTFKLVVYWFQLGYSIQELAKKLQCEEWEIEYAIRTVLKRQKRRR